MTMRAQLLPLDGGPAIEISKDLTVVGRKEDCDLRLGHKSVSKMHCIIVKTDGLLLLRDLGSTNGTWLNGKRLAAQQLTKLRPGDVLQFGGQSEEVTFKVKMCHVSVEEQLKRYLGGAAVPVGPAAAAAETNGSSSNGNGAGKAGSGDQAAKELVGAGK
jgi:predicted component of type VI protein secretion system